VAATAPQQQRQRGWKLYSFHAPEVECIGKGKAGAPYEFRVKASIVTTNARAPPASSCYAPRRCRETPTMATRSALSLKPPKGSPAARSSAPMSTRDTAATIPPIRAASSSPARSAVSSAWALLCLILTALTQAFTIRSVLKSAC
jgi:hypothetical protein